MMRHRRLLFGLSLLLLCGGVSTAQESGPCSLTIPVKAVGQGKTFFQVFHFRPGSPSFPGVSSGQVDTGGLAIEEVKSRVARQVQRTVYDYVVVFVNGRPTVERRARIVVETVYEDVSELREFTLPFTSGAWSSIDLCLYSTWSIFHVGPDGTVIGMGTTVGNQLYGSVLYIGVEGLPSGWYTLSTGEPGGSAGGGGGGGGGGNPPA